MAIIGTLPSQLANGTTADATQVMADFNFIVNQVNANGAPIGTLTAPAGTRTVFNQAAAPLGWAIDNTVQDNGLWVTNNVTGGGVQNSNTAFSGFLTGAWSTAGHALTVSEIPPHTHNVPVTLVNAGGSGQGLAGGGVSGSEAFNSDSGTGGGGAHTHTNSAAWNYIACVVAQKS